MLKKHKKATGFIQSLLARFGGVANTDPDLLLQSSVDSSLAQLSAFAHQGRASSGTKPGEPAMSRTQNAFGFRLFSELIDGAQQNVFVSPISVALMLSMAYNGAAGETKRVMAQALQLQGMSLEDLNRGSTALIRWLNKLNTDVEICVANSLWARNADLIAPAFREQSAAYYQAELHDLVGAPDTINEWAEQRTNGNICRAVGGPIGDKIEAILVNVIYFWGRWDEPFDLRLTHEHRFHLLNGRQSTCQMMFQTGMYDYLDARDFQAIRLPYRNRDFSMFVFLPGRHVVYSDFLSRLTPQHWAIWRSEFRRREGSIKLPRFRCNYTKYLSGVLRQLGMGIAFDRDRADFPYLCPHFYLDLVGHTTFLEVNEEGTEAAAVTGILCGCASPQERDEPFKMVVDGPFFCAIVDERTDTMLFMGAIVEP